MYGIVRVFWGTEMARKLRGLLQPGTEPARRLDAFLKNQSIRIYAITHANEPGGYFATANTPGEQSLVCYYYKEIRRNIIRPTTIQLLMNHTGTSHIMMMGESPEHIARMESLGFILVENNWVVKTDAYAGLRIDSRIQDVSGLPADLMNSDDMHALDIILSCAIIDEGNLDPLERRVLSLVRPSEVIERSRGGQYRTLVWREDRTIKGMINLAHSVGGDVSVLGLGVHPKHQKQRIGRNLLAAALQLASKTHTHVTASTFAGNLPADHLMSLLRFTKMPGTYGMVVQEDVVDWKRSKGSTKNNKITSGPVLVE